MPLAIRLRSDRWCPHEGHYLRNYHQIQITSVEWHNLETALCPRFPPAGAHRPQPHSAFT
jgi:hypothetical protein